MFTLDHPEIRKSTFEAAWHDPECSPLRVRRWNPFAKCDMCTRFNDLLKATQDRSAIKKIIAEAQAHKVYYRGEKAFYLERTLKAIRQPDDFLSLITDGADQKDYDVPYTATRNRLLYSSEFPFNCSVPRI